jgi:hypothetical protein
MTRFMQRIFSAQEKNETVVLDQLEQDLKTVQKSKKFSTEEIDYELVDDSIIAHDNETGEETVFVPNGNHFEMLDTSTLPTPGVEPVVIEDPEPNKWCVYAKGGTINSAQKRTFRGDDVTIILSGLNKEAAHKAKSNLEGVLTDSEISNGIKYGVCRELELVASNSTKPLEYTFSVKYK